MPDEPPDGIPDGRWVDYQCRRPDEPTERDGFRSCHHCGELHRTTHDRTHPKDRDGHHPKDRDGHRPSAHRAERADGSHLCRHGPVHETTHGTDRAAAPDDRERDAARHRNTNPRCRHRRRLPGSRRPPNFVTSIPTTNSTTPAQLARRPDADASRNRWATRETGAATLRWEVRSSEAAIRCRTRNSTGPNPTDRDQPDRRRRNAVHRIRRHRRRNGRSHPGRRLGATCRRSSVPPALRPRAVPALSCPRPDRSSRHDPG